jgi:succinoglycan biosynthesis protein ExoA
MVGAVGVRAKQFVSIVMPALNEERYIEAAIHSIIPQSDELHYEVLVVDGGSTDRTRAIVVELAAGNDRIRFIPNPKRIQAAGVNLAARLADPRSIYLVRADCHVRYPERFVELCVRDLSSKQVASVVVPMRTEGKACMQRAIAAAQNSRLGNGGASHRLIGWSGFVDHGHHAGFDRKAFLELGGYDERFSHNEDAEFDTRLIRTGRRIYMNGDAAVTYFPRTDLASLARQYFSHGRGRASTLLKHRKMPRIRQGLPVAIVLAVALSAGLAVFEPWFLLLPVLYAMGCLLGGAGLAIRASDRCVMLSGVAAIVMHMSWGTGFLARLAGWRGPHSSLGGRSKTAQPAG